jgi:hypothetical protein
VYLAEIVSPNITPPLPPLPPRHQEVEF